jgi:ABC-type multidrug transport system ATPase subunit
MISARGLTVVGLGSPVISDVSIRAGAGECVGLRGVSGSGKTTLLQALAGWVRPTAGSIHLDHDDRPADASLLRRRVGYAAIEAMVGHGLRVDEYLRFVAQVKASGRDVQAAAYTAVARRAGLDPSAAITRLTPAQHAALAIAAAVVSPVVAVLVDAAIDALALEERARVVSWLAEIRDRGTAILIASNDATVQNALCHRVVTLARGTVVEESHMMSAPVATGHTAAEVSSP